MAEEPTVFLLFCSEKTAAIAVLMLIFTAFANVYKFAVAFHTSFLTTEHHTPLFLLK